MVRRDTDPGAGATSWLLDRQLMGIVLLDQDGIVIDRLGALVEWVKIGQRSTDSIPFLTGHADALEAVAQGRRPALFLSEEQDPEDVEARRRSISIHCFRTSGGPGVTLLFLDITARGELEDSAEQGRSGLALGELRMVESEESAAVSNLSRTQFLALVSHELRTPLNVIIGNAEILRDWDPDTFSAEDLRIFAEDILDNGTFLLDHINDLLDLARADIGGIDLDEAAVDIGPLVDGAVAAVRKLPHAGALTIRHEPRGALPRLMGDHQRLRQIMLNLLADAVGATPGGGSVLVRTFVADDGALTIEISHDDVGTGSATQKGVLQPNGMANTFSGNQARSENVLGLPLARTLIELHHGTLSQHDEPGEPARTTLRFPPHRCQAVT